MSPGAAPPVEDRVLLIAGTSTFDNVGDIAMCQVALGRLRRARPGVRPVLLAVEGATEGHGLGEVTTVALDGWTSWCRRVHEWRRGTARLPGVADVAYRRPRLALALLRLRGRRVNADVHHFVDLVRGAALVVVCGQGGLHDGSARRAERIADVLRLAAAAGVPSVLLGQGVGPLDAEGLAAELGDALAAVSALGLRDERSGDVVERIGVRGPVVEVTGDDALALVAERPPPLSRSRIGVSIRVNDASEVEASVATEVGVALAGALPDVPVQLLSFMEQPPIVSDARAGARVAAEVTSVEGPNALRVADAIEALDRCRLVVTGTYHAAVFALGMGIPVIGLARSPYYHQKLEGVLGLFGAGAGCVLDPTAATFATELEATVARLWEDAPARGADLRARARTQVDAGARFARTALAPS
ncbi:MAG: polysaccharide pyruvyl transferase family protein [Iamia sp.]